MTILQEFGKFYSTIDADWGMVYMMMGMSVFVAFFHTVILTGLYELKLRPKWLFFAINPLLIYAAASVERKLGVAFAVVMFLSVFVLGILGMVYVAFRSSLEEQKARNKDRERRGQKARPLWFVVLLSISTVLLVALMVIGGPYTIILFLFFIPFAKSVKGSPEKSFYTLQRTLPTAPIRSVAMGLAEISGSIRLIEPKISRIKKKTCAGYYYTIENVTRDNDGDNSYSLEFSELECKSVLC